MRGLAPGRARGTLPRRGRNAGESQMKTDSHIALFRRLALELPGAVEGSHMNQPDFRLNNQIFATLFAQEKGCGVLKLTPEQQGAFIPHHPPIFSPLQRRLAPMASTFFT